jgi:UPF0755 protein
MTTKSSKGNGGNRQKAWLVWTIFLVTCFSLAIWGVNRWWLWAIAPPSLERAVLDRESLDRERLAQKKPIQAKPSNPVNPSKISEPQKIRVTIQPNTPLQSIGDRLEAAKVIRSNLALKLWVKLNNDLPIQAGTYEFLPNQGLGEVVAQMQSGQLVDVKFTIAEGWSVAQVGAYFEQEGFFKATDFVAAANEVTKHRVKNAWLPPTPNLEGYLFPDTYQMYPEDVTPARVIEVMLGQFEQVALPLYVAYQAKKPAKKTLKIKRIFKLSLQEWVTLASIVEKEAVLSEERSRIAGVFTNRLQKGMRLESDPTVEYALGIKQTVQQPLTLSQVQSPSPYNTYLNSGLPPGAIAAPGLASLKATLNPTKTTELFFVARYDGSHIFSQTYEHHKLAIAQVEKSLKP